MRRSFLFLAKICLLLSMVVLLNSCATVLGSRSNTLSFTSSQTAQIYIDDKLVGEAPGKIKLPAKQIQHGSTLRIESEGFESQEYTILRKPNVAYTAVDLVGSLFMFGVPIAVDYADGYIYRPVPRKFAYELKPIN